MTLEEYIIKDYDVRFEYVMFPDSRIDYTQAIIITPSSDHTYDICEGMISEERKSFIVAVCVDDQFRMDWLVRSIKPYCTPISDNPIVEVDIPPIEKVLDTSLEDLKKKMKGK